MDFKLTRGKNAAARCKNVNPTYGSPLYCNCGCQTPRKDDNPNLEAVSLEWRDVDGSFDQNPCKLIRTGSIVGFVDGARDYVCIDQNEYLGVCGGALSTLCDNALTMVRSNASKLHVSPGETHEETASRVRLSEQIELAESDERHKNHPGYCKKCHSFCYGDCES